jgi:glycosyltransferase involved in cell wall biosynthesis
MEQHRAPGADDTPGSPSHTPSVRLGPAAAAPGNGRPQGLPGVSVVIPAYNEEDGIRGVVSRVGRVLAGAGVEHEVIVVDDGSSDNTYPNAREVCATVLRHPGNRGYGAALKTGIRSARYELIGITDADGTYPVEDLPRLIAACAQEDMVVGARTGAQVHIPWPRRPAKYLLKVLADFLTATRIPDLNSGMRVLRRGLVLEYIDILPDRFSFTTTITLAGLCDGYRVKFLPIAYQRRTGRSKIKPYDFLNFIILILRTMAYFRPLRMFVPLALLLFAIGFGKLLMDFYYVNVKGTSVLFCLAGLHMLSLGVVADLICFLRRRRTPVRDLMATPPGADNGRAGSPPNDQSFSNAPQTPGRSGEGR